MKRGRKVLGSLGMLGPMIIYFFKNDLLNQTGVSTWREGRHKKIKKLATKLRVIYYISFIIPYFANACQRTLQNAK